MELNKKILKALVLFVCVASLSFDLCADARSNFRFIRLQLQNDYLVADDRPENKIPDQEFVEPKNLIVLKLHYFHTPKKGFWRELFDPRNPIAIAASTSANPLLSMVEERLIDYQDDNPNTSYILRDLNLFGPVFIGSLQKILVAFRIFNVRLPEEQRSLFRQVINIAREKIHELEPFTGILDKFTGRLEEKYNISVKVHQYIPLVNQRLYKGYWLLIPQHSEKERQFSSSVEKKKYLFSTDGSQVVEFLKDKTDYMDVTEKAPLFILLSLETIPFRPSVWLTTINMLMTEPVTPDISDASVLRLKNTADSARPEAELYIYGLLRQRFYFDLDRYVTPEAERLGAAKRFLDDFIGVPYKRSSAKEAFQLDLPLWLRLPPNDEFLLGVQGNADQIAAALRARLDDNDILLSDSIYELRLISDMVHPFKNIQNKKIPENAPEEEINMLVDEYLNFASKSWKYMKSEVEEIKKAILDRFVFSESAKVWSLDTLAKELQYRKTKGRFLAIGNQILWSEQLPERPLEGVWDFKIEYTKFHGIVRYEDQFEANGKAFFIWRPDAKVYDIYIAIFVCKIPEGDKKIVTGFIRGTSPANNKGWPGKDFAMSMKYEARTGLKVTVKTLKGPKLIDLGQPSTAAFIYSNCNIGPLDEEGKPTKINGLFLTSASEGAIYFTR